MNTKSTQTSSLYKPVADSANTAQFGPATIEKRTDATALTRLGTSFMKFDETGTSEPWTLRYEETIYVISGQTEIDIITSGSNRETIVGSPGDLLVLPEGTTVCYRGTKDTYLLLSITPVNWRDLA